MAKFKISSFDYMENNIVKSPNNISNGDPILDLPIEIDNKVISEEIIGNGVILEQSRISCEEFYFGQEFKVDINLNA